MKKMKLVLEDLQVESFAADPKNATNRGTVAGLVEEASGMHSECYTYCSNCVTVCEGLDTCGWSCWVDETCGKGPGTTGEA